MLLSGCEKTDAHGTKIRQAQLHYNGHLSTVKWAHENGCPRDQETCSAAAAMYGELEILRWLRAHGCPWNTGTCANAANQGRLEAVGATKRMPLQHFCGAYCCRRIKLLTLKTHGCPWDEEAFDVAIECRAWTCLKYLVDNKCPGVNEEIFEFYEEHCSKMT